MWKVGGVAGKPFQASLANACRCLCLLAELDSPPPAPCRLSRCRFAVSCTLAVPRTNVPPTIPYSVLVGDAGRGIGCGRLHSPYSLIPEVSMMRRVNARLKLPELGSVLVQVPGASRLGGPARGYFCFHTLEAIALSVVKLIALTPLISIPHNVGCNCPSGPGRPRSSSLPR